MPAVAQDHDPVADVAKHTPNWKASAYLAAAGTTRRLPNFRGKVGALLRMYRWLGLEQEPVAVQTSLHRPRSFRVQLDFRCLHERFAYLMDGWEPETVRLLLRLFEPPGYVLEIGANVGLITIPLAITLADADPDGSSPVVFAMEPVPANIAALKRNIALNHLQSRIAVLECAAGRERSRQPIEIEAGRNQAGATGTANIIPAEWAANRPSTLIQVERIDDLYAAGTLPRGCRVIKIDTDGYDLLALQGAEAFIDQERPLIFGEFCLKNMRWHGHSFEAVCDFATQHRYLCYAGALHGRPAPANTPTGDLLLVPDDRVSDMVRMFPDMQQLDRA